MRSTAFALLFLVAGCGSGEVKKTLCASHLKQLWMVKGAGTRKLSSTTGRAFWLESHSSADAEFFVCPLSGKIAAAGVTTYRGPSRPVDQLTPGDVVGACLGVHSDGSASILRKDGSVVVAEKGDPAIAEARGATSD